MVWLPWLASLTRSEGWSVPFWRGFGSLWGLWGENTLFPLFASLFSFPGSTLSGTSGFDLVLWLIENTRMTNNVPTWHLGNGNKDYRLRNPSSLILGHTHSPILHVNHNHIHLERAQNICESFGASLGENAWELQAQNDFPRGTKAFLLTPGGNYPPVIPNKPKPAARCWKQATAG